MSLNPVKLIYQFNQKAGLLSTGYIDEKESAFPIEEALEGFSDIALLARQVLCENTEEGYEGYTPKDISRAIVALAHMNGEVTEYLSDVDRLDKHLDIIVYSFGSIFKLGLTPQQALAALEIVAQANMQKLSVGIDDHGKQMKPTNFVGPEEKLQAILDKRNS